MSTLEVSAEVSFFQKLFEFKSIQPTTDLISYIAKG